MTLYMPLFHGLLRSNASSLQTGWLSHTYVTANTHHDYNAKMQSIYTNKLTRNVYLHYVCE